MIQVTGSKKVSNRATAGNISRNIYSGLLGGVIGLAFTTATFGSLGVAGAIARTAEGAAIERVSNDFAHTMEPPLQNKSLLDQSLPEQSLQANAGGTVQMAGRRAIAQPEVRSIWLDRETIVSAGSPQGLAKVFERFKSAGINTVFVETVNAGYPIYPSTVAPEQNPLINGWDPLGAAVELGKSHNIEVHAWVWLFAAGNQAHNRIVGQPASYPGPILSARPDWAGYDNQGNLIIPGQTKTFLDPANSEVRQYLFDILSEIAGRYDVDGIQFDYVRYPFQDPESNRLFGYGTAAREEFQSLTGVDPIDLSPKNGGDPRRAYYWNQWVTYRTQKITSFVAEASQRLRHQKPGITLSAAVFADDTYKRQHTLQQDWEDWADQGLVDWIVLMSYASSTERFEELIRPWVVESSYRSTRVIPGIRLLNLPTAIAEGQLQLLRNFTTSGYALFAADNLNSEVQQMLADVHTGDEQIVVLENEESIVTSKIDAIVLSADN